MEITLNILTDIWIIGVFIVFILSMITWGHVLGRPQLLLITIVSVLWPVYLPLALLDNWRHRKT